MFTRDRNSIYDILCRITPAINPWCSQQAVLIVDTFNCSTIVENTLAIQITCSVHVSGRKGEGKVIKLSK